MRTTYLVYLFIAFSAAGVASFMVVDVLYFQAIGYSLTFVGVMAAAFNLSVSVAELPFAILFDRYSNKIALQIGNLIRMSAFVLFFFHLNTTSLFIASVLAGIGVAAASGTSQALIINGIRNRTPDGMSAALGRICYLVAGASLVGGVAGVMAFRSFPEAIWLIALVCFVMAAVALALIKDKSRSKPDFTWKDFFQQCSKIIYIPSAGLLILTHATAIAPFMFWQVKFNSVSLIFLLIGFCLINFSGILAPFLLTRLQLKVHHVGWVALANIVATTLFAYLQERWLMELSFFMHVTLQTVQTILITGLFHSSIENTIRATASSIISLMDSLLVMGLAPFVGWIGQHFGVSLAILISVGLYAIVALVAFINKFHKISGTTDQIEASTPSEKMYT